jgi:hypothetical protein
MNDEKLANEGFNENRAIMIIVDRSIDLQSVLCNSYSYSSNIFENLHVP